MMSILFLSSFTNFYFFFTNSFKEDSWLIQSTPGFNFLKFLFPFDNMWSFLDYIWNLMLSNKINTFTFFLVLFLGVILMCWTAREVITWFLQTKKIAKQNQLLINQNKILMEKIEAINSNFNNTEPLYSLTGRNMGLGETTKSAVISDIDDPLIDIHEPSVKKPFSKEPSLDT